LKPEHMRAEVIDFGFCRKEMVEGTRAIGICDAEVLPWNWNQERVLEAWMPYNNNIFPREIFLIAR